MGGHVVGGPCCPGKDPKAPHCPAKNLYCQVRGWMDASINDTYCLEIGACGHEGQPICNHRYATAHLLPRLTLQTPLLPCGSHEGSAGLCFEIARQGNSTPLMLVLLPVGNATHVLQHHAELSLSWHVVWRSGDAAPLWPILGTLLSSHPSCHWSASSVAPEMRLPGLPLSEVCCACSTAGTAPWTYVNSEKNAQADVGELRCEVGLYYNMGSILNHANCTANPPDCGTLGKVRQLTTQRMCRHIQRQVLWLDVCLPRSLLPCQ